jgi:tryptophanyl-tRNA synthetase
MIQFRQRTPLAPAARDKEALGAGVFFYPILMAADILLYDADIVPVGEDQQQHLELCRNLVRRVDRRYGHIFHMPEARFAPAGARVRGLSDPTRKMSKSTSLPLDRIGLLDPPAQIRKAIARATTDSGRDIAYDPEHRPGLANLVAMVAALKRQSPEETARIYADAGADYGELKRDLIEAVREVFSPIQSRARSWMDDPRVLDAVLERGARRALEVAGATLRRVRDAIGLLPPGGSGAPPGGASGQ